MERAAVLIGVSRTGGLETLQAVESGVDAMEKWARDQHIPDDRVVRITDAGARPVTATEIKQRIAELCVLGTLDQLIVYFAGHGVNKGYSEYWLLSDAPADTQAAVNLAGSELLARRCGIPHVVLISDACRTAASGTPAQFVSGSEIFPNTGGAGPESAVDIFFATLLGSESNEVAPKEAAGRYTAVFTDALASALMGEQPDVLDVPAPGAGTFAFVRPRPLKRFLPKDVARRLDAARVALDISQEPDARITSDDDDWLSRLTAVPARPLPPVAASPAPAGRPLDHGSPFEESQSLLRDRLDASATPEQRHGGRLLAAIHRVEQPFGAGGPDDLAGFRVRGARVVSAESWRAQVSVRPDRATVVVEEMDGPAADVLLTFEHEVAVVLPAVRDFVAGLTFDQGELEDVALEPIPSSWRRAAYDDRAAQLASLRAVIASSARLGLFRLETDDTDRLASELQLAKGVDPSLALYAAYAFDDLRDGDRVRTMDDVMRADLGARLFDVAMLGGRLDGTAPAPEDDVFPSTPLLSQGWATLRARQISLHPAYDGVEAHLRPSLWTLFDPQGAAMARLALEG